MQIDSADRGFSFRKDKIGPLGKIRCGIKTKKNKEEEEEGEGEGKRGQEKNDVLRLLSDMRMDNTMKRTAADVLNTASESSLADILFYVRFFFSTKKF